MKKVVMLSAVAMLSLASAAVSQAQSTASATGISEKSTNSAPTLAASASAGNKAASSTTGTASTASATTTAKAKEPVPQDPPQVQKLIALYPNLIARIAPQGKVCCEGKDCDITIAATLGPADPNKPREGKVIYEGVCHTCHATGLLGSPKFGDKGLWAPRIAKGIDTLHQHALHGFNAMPVKGGNTDLLDVEVTNAVDYMVANGR